MPRWANSLHARLLALMLAVLLPALSFSAFLAIRTAIAERMTLEAHTHDLASVLVSLLDREMASAIGSLHALAASPHLRDGDLAAFHRQAVGAPRRAAQIYVLFEPSGRILLDTLRPFGTLLPRRTDLAPLRPIFERGETFVSDVTTSSLDGRLVFGVTAPVIRDGQVIYALGLATRLDDVPGAVLAQFKVPPDWAAAIFDRNGVIAARLPFGAVRPGQRASPATAGAIAAAPAGGFYVDNPEGVPVYAAWKRSELSGWTAGVSVPASALLAPLHRSLWLLGAAGAAVLTLSALLAWLGAQRIAAPILRLRSAALALGRCDAPTVALKGGARLNEVGIVEQAIAEAATDLRRHEAQRDKTERRLRDNEAHLALLAREVDHRAKNILAIVQALVRRTQAPSITGLREAITGRITALARAHTLLSASRWEGAEIGRLIDEELAMYRASGHARVHAEGPALTLQPAAALPMAMALHELATNAAKFGALSMPQGRVVIDWLVDGGGGLVLRWTEEGGPPVRPPDRAAIGLDVIERVVRDQLDGKADFEWRSTGLACVITLPAAQLVRALDH